jgi:hypothetical protein
MSAKYKSPSFLLPNELNTSANPLNTDGNPATGTGINSLYSMDFDAPSSTYVDLGIITEINGLSNFSFSVWIKPVSPLGGSQGIVFGNRNPNDASKGIAFALHRNLTGVSYVYFEGNLLSIPTGTFTFDQWSHVVITYDNAILAVYVDNSLIDSASLANLSLTSIAAFNLGRDVAVPVGKYFNGQIDEFAIFNRALDATERAALYDGTGSNIRPSNLMATNLGPLAYYPLGEQAQNSGYPSATGNEWQFPNGVLQDYVMDFDGTNDYIDIPSSSSLVFGSEDFTISFWIKTSDSTANILNPISSQGAGFFGLMIYQSKLRWNDQYNVSNLWVINNTQIVTNTWINVVIIKNSGTFYVWYNNVPQTLTATSDSQNYNGDNGLRIGSGNLGDLDGQLSNLAIWNSDQTTNVTNIYNNGSPQTTYTVTPQNWWKLNADSVYTPSAPNYTTALDFDGSSDYIDITQSGTLPPNSGDFTYSSWVNIDPSTSINIIVLLNKGDAWPGNGILIRYRSYFEVLINGVVYGFTGLTAVDGPGAWRHFALVFDETANTLTAYVDTNKEVKSATTTLNVSDANFIIGKRQNNIQYFKGKMSNLAVYSSALTDSQISTLFNFGTPETTPSFSPAAWWKLNDQNAITDSSGNGHTGTNNGATNSPGGVAYVPSWKITSALPIPTVNYTSALEFNRPTANNEYVDIGTISFLNQAGDFTISQWVNPANVGSIHNMPIQFGTLSNFIFLRNNAWQYEFRGGQRQYVPTNGVPVPEEEWIHIALTVEGTVSKFYQNGDLKHTGVVGTTYSANAVRIGNYYSLSYPWYGQISNTALFDSALIDSDIDTLYNNGQPEATPSFSPLHWWKLDNTTTGIQDSVGSSNGTLVQTSTPGAEEVATNVYIGSIPVNGVSTTLPSTALQQSDLQFDSPYSNYSLDFDGATNYIDCTNYQFSTTKTSISAWFKSSDTRSSEFTEILSKYSDTSAEFQMRLNTGTTKTLTVFLLISGSSYVTCTTTSTWNDGNWHNVIFTYDSSFASGKLYIDGALQASDTTTSGAHTPGDANLYIGARQSNSIEKEFLGNIDETAIWKGTYLSQAQVLEIYNNGKPSNLENFSGTLPSSWWRLGENAYFDNNAITVPNSIAGAPNGVGPGTVTTMLSADAPGTYANGIGDGLAITDRVGDAPLSVANSQSYNMIPDDKVPYVPGYVGAQTTNASEMTFDGTNYFNAGNASSLNWGTGDGSVSCWFKTSYNAPGVQDLVINGSYASGGKGYILYLDSSERVGFYLDDNSSPSGVLSTSSVNDGDWHHVVGVRDSGTMKLYLDGSEIATGTDNTGNIDISDPLIIGAGQAFGGSVGNFFNGQIDEVAIFDEALTPDQIKFDLYEPTALVGGVEKTADIENNTNLPTPVAWYRMGD